VVVVVHVPKPPRLHDRWVILAVTSLTVLMAAGITAVPAVLIHPLEVEFGWDRAAIALAVSINVLLYGLAGPFAGGLMLRFGPRRVMLTSLALIACGVAATTQLRSLLQLYLLWGVVVGLGTGSTALVLSATVVNRWFTTHRGLALGLLGAATSTGRLIFLPLLATVVIALGWQAVGWVVAGCITLLVLPLVALLMRDSPAQTRKSSFPSIPCGSVAAKFPILTGSCLPWRRRPECRRSQLWWRRRDCSKRGSPQSCGGKHARRSSSSSRRYWIIRTTVRRSPQMSIRQLWPRSYGARG
jgi:MFS family permease